MQYTIYGELCNPTTGASHTLELTVPGGTYGHIYWDFPYEPQTYSYVYAANAAGYSTFNIDRIGTGLSSHPSLSVVDVTMNTNAYVIHEIVQDLRNGEASGISRLHRWCWLLTHEARLMPGLRREPTTMLMASLSAGWYTISMHSVWGTSRTFYPGWSLIQFWYEDMVQATDNRARNKREGFILPEDTERRCDG